MMTMIFKYLLYFLFKYHLGNIAEAMRKWMLKYYQAVECVDMTQSISHIAISVKGLSYVRYSSQGHHICNKLSA